MKKITFVLLIVIFLSSCANYKEQVKTSVKDNTSINSDIAHTFYLIGDAGNAPLNEKTPTLEAFENEIKNASKNSTVLFLGDNIYENGLPKKSNPEYKLAKHRLKIQTDAVKNFQGEAIFIPGNHDWYSGLSGLKRQEEYVEKRLGKDTFLPENGCPIDKIHISDDIELIIIDSHWYMTSWDKHPTMNDECEIKTRTDFFNEFSSLIKKSRGKTTIVALHHPIYTNGPHGGEYSLGSHMKPIPVLGTLKNLIRETSGITNTDLQNKRYNEFKQRFTTIAQANEKVIIVSGHEHSLQYIINDNLHQIISGSGSKVSPTRLKEDGIYTYGTNGFAKLEIYKNGASKVSFFTTDDAKYSHENIVFEQNKEIQEINYPKQFPKTKKASVYTDEEAHATGIKKFLWGDRYRKYYNKPVEVPTVNLDTLFGGLTPVRKGGGNQSKSLRLKDKNGTQYVMRALHKNAIQYLQAILFKHQYIEGQFDDTETEKFLLDIFTGSHPYAPFAIGDLSDAVGVFHTNPVLYYVPKQDALGSYNTDFGNELYMIEEHTSAGHSNLASFGFKDKIISTDDLMHKIHNTEDAVVDEAAYIKARLFDMLIGDWDRHQDQWHWIEFKENGKKVYRPLPRDRDQAFSIMADGFLLGSAVKFIPAARLLRVYDEDLVDVKGVNVEPYPLDVEFIQQSNKEVWNAQVKVIQNGITDEVIEKAFLNIPEEVRDETIEEIKRKLKGRRKNLQKISDRYFDLVNRYTVIKGTNKDDWFDIERLANGETKITAYRIKKGEKGEIFHQRTYNRNETKEIWIYGLDDDDMFHVFGSNSDREIKVRLIGGQNNDTYDIQNGKKVTFYDFKSKKNTVTTKKGNKKFSDSYKINTYNYKKLKNNTTQIIPTIGANPDDGLKLGVATTFTNFGFERNPFSSQHKISAAYFLATDGLELNYSGEFANLFKNTNLLIEANYNSPKYATNFFGFGNNSLNPEANEDDGFDVDLDYNRVKIEQLKFAPSIVWRGELGASFKAGISYENNKVKRTNGRYIAILPANSSVFDNQEFLGIDTHYNFENKDNPAFPTLGFLFDLNTGIKRNLTTDKSFGYIIPEIGFDYKIVPSGKLVLATNFRSHITLGNNFEFYQGANLGADTGLRGYRDERFTGKSSFVQSTDLRWNFTNLKTNLVPIHLGIYGGFDYGRVWVDNSTSNKWNNAVGGGVFINFADMMTGNISAFNSDEGMRFAFKMGFGF